MNRTSIQRSLIYIRGFLGWVGGAVLFCGVKLCGERLAI